MPPNRACALMLVVLSGVGCAATAPSATESEVPASSAEGDAPPALTVAPPSPPTAEPRGTAPGDDLPPPAEDRPAPRADREPDASPSPPTEPAPLEEPTRPTAEDLADAASQHPRPPRQWWCYGWVHGPRSFGSGCHHTARECRREASESGHQNVSPCHEVETAFCMMVRAEEMCFSVMAQCHMRQGLLSSRGIDHGLCVERPRLAAR